MSEAMVELGLGQRVVGRSPWCMAVGADVPVVGTLLDCDFERLLASAPDLVLAQREHGAGPDELARFCAAQNIQLIQMRIDSIEDVEAMVQSLAARFGGEAVARAAAWQARLRALDSNVSPSATRVLILSEGAPFLAFGRGTYLDGMLGRLGLDNAANTTGYPTLLCEDLLAIDPDAILLIADEGKASDELAGALNACGVRAALDGRVYATGADALTPGASLPSWGERVHRLLSSSGATRSERSPQERAR